MKKHPYKMIIAALFGVLLPILFTTGCTSTDAAEKAKAAEATPAAEKAKAAEATPTP